MALTAAVDGSTYVLRAAFTDESGAAMTPASITWSLRDNTGNVVNNRSAVSVVTSSVVTVVLSGDDLLYEPNSSTMRTFTIRAVYNGTYGTGLPLNAEATFDVTNLVGI